MQVGGVSFVQVEPNVLRATPAAPLPDGPTFVTQVRSAFFPLAARTVFQRLVALSFHLDKGETVSGDFIAIGRFDIKLGDPRTAIGLAPVVEQPTDTFLARDKIIEAELAASDAPRTAKLLADPALVRAVEYFIRAVLYPHYLMANAYEAIEVIQKKLGSRQAFTSIGLSKGYVDYVMRPASQSQYDERHAPDTSVPVLIVSDAEKQESLRRVREVISRYAASL